MRSKSFHPYDPTYRLAKGDVVLVPMIVHADRGQSYVIVEYPPVIAGDMLDRDKIAAVDTYAVGVDDVVLHNASLHEQTVRAVFSNGDGVRMAAIERPSGLFDVVRVADLVPVDRPQVAPPPLPPIVMPAPAAAAE